MKIHWKKTVKNVSFMILMLKMCVIFGQKKIIIIDPGHGGKDSGTIGINGIKEKDVVLGIALEILSLNQHSENPMDIYLTRYSDTLISLSDRSILTKALNVDIFISLHCNHSDNQYSRGIEVYVGKIESRYSKESSWFAYYMQHQFKKRLGFESRGVKFGNFQVLRDNGDFCPSLLFELGFLSNADESSYFSNFQNIRWAALAILVSTQRL